LRLIQNNPTLSGLCHGTWLEAWNLSQRLDYLLCVVLRYLPLNEWGTSGDKVGALCRSRTISRLPEVQEAHALTGEMDYYLKVVTPDLKALSRFVNEELLPHDSVQHVKTAIVLETLKETGALPL
jgi:DNA-binding Lrp family transcriptional regulator